jgi:MFS family permease
MPRKSTNTCSGSERKLTVACSGTINDMVEDKYRAAAFSAFGIGPMNGPVFGPVIGGFVFQYLGWRWTNWLVLILGGVALLLMVLVKETYAPALLREKARKVRKEKDEPRWWSRYDQKASLYVLLKVNLSRPFIMTLTEPIWYVYPIIYLLFWLIHFPQHILVCLRFSDLWNFISMLHCLSDRVSGDQGLVSRNRWT